MLLKKEWKKSEVLFLGHITLLYAVKKKEFE